MEIILTGTIETAEELTAENVGGASFVLGNVAMPEGSAPPKGGLTLYYGFRSTIEAMAIAQAAAAARGLYINPVVVTLDLPDPGGDSNTSQLRLEDLPHARFLHLERMDRGIGDLVANYWAKYLEKEGVDIVDETGGRWPPSLNNLTKILAERPDLIGDLHKEKPFKHLDVIVYPIIEEGVRGHRGTLFDRAGVVSVQVRSFPEIDVRLPKTLKHSGATAGASGSADR